MNHNFPSLILEKYIKKLKKYLYFSKISSSQPLVIPMKKLTLNLGLDDPKTYKSLSHMPYKVFFGINVFWEEIHRPLLNPLFLSYLKVIGKPKTNFQHEILYQICNISGIKINKKLKFDEKKFALS